MPVGFVAVLLDELELELELDVGFVRVLDDLVVEDDELLEEVLEELEELLEQSRAASALTVTAPCPRLRINVVLTLDGSAPTSFENCWAAWLAAPHWPAATAAEIELS